MADNRIRAFLDRNKHKTSITGIHDLIPKDNSRNYQQYNMTSVDNSRSPSPGHSRKTVSPNELHKIKQNFSQTQNLNIPSMADLVQQQHIRQTSGIVLTGEELKQTQPREKSRDSYLKASPLSMKMLKKKQPQKKIERVKSTTLIKGTISSEAKKNQLKQQSISSGKNSSHEIKVFEMPKQLLEKVKTEIMNVKESEEWIQPKWTDETIQKLDEQFSVSSIEQDLKNLDNWQDNFISKMFTDSQEQKIQENMTQRRSISQNAQALQTLIKSKTTDNLQNDGQNRKMIMEYLNVVKTKITELDSKLDEANKETEYFKRKCIDEEQKNNDMREKEQLLAMKYGVLITQNQELQGKLSRKSKITQLRGNTQ